MSESRETDKTAIDKLKDSPENWISVTLFFSGPDYEVFQKIILTVAPRLRESKTEGKISYWHFRFGCASPQDVCFRIKPAPNQRNRVMEEIPKLLSELRQKGLIKAHSFEHYRFKFTEDSILERYKSWVNWQIVIECEEHLSEIVYKILTQQNYEEREQILFHGIAVHMLFNMLAKQELFQSYEFRQGRHRELIPLLADQSAAQFTSCLDKMMYEDALKEIPLKSVFFFDKYQIKKEEANM